MSCIPDNCESGILTFVPFSFHSAEIFSPPRSINVSMDPSPRDKEKAPFACDVYSVNKVTVTNTGLKAEHAVHGDDSSNVLIPDCEYSSSSKCRVADHLIGFHGTAESFACDHPGCTFRSTWRKSIASHKQHMHSDVKPFACTACSFCAKTRSNLSRYKNAVHLNIRVSKRCRCLSEGIPIQISPESPHGDI